MACTVARTGNWLYAKTFCRAANSLVLQVCNGEDIQDLQHAALLLVNAAYASWLQHDGACNRDITVLILQGSEFVEDMPGIFNDVPAFAAELGL